MALCGIDCSDELMMGGWEEEEEREGKGGEREAAAEGRPYKALHGTFGRRGRGNPKGN